ncbi:FCS-Like Zinc finger 2 [Ziziphus jujuba]|uniref:FCS-Like Zinc finger 2 n=2 Tax=Ziziphus jujuba TaxID=326968 RepID=A0A6P4B3V4_ZIZJJ|nr:FCS-Like Zinc finger 2 [Ziziphus jujuba]KAH7514327.1 hypothetical protein FEM48_Zijuj11G0077100 [Ziziphus jujuba var. spinosa]
MKMESVTSTRRPCFVEEDDGLASLADMEAGFSGNHHPFYYSRPLCYSRRSSFRNLLAASSSSFSSCTSSPRSGGWFYDARFEDHQPHFLESCFLCKKPLGDGRDIYMYRGDTPFCSEECRKEQMDMDEAEEKNMNVSSSRKALRQNDQRKSNSPTKTRGYAFRTGTVAAA